MEDLRLILTVVLGLALVPLAFLESKLIVNASTKPRVGPFGLAAGGILFSSFGLLCAYLTYGAIQSESAHCLSRRCSFYYSAAEQPLEYWVAILLWYAISVFLLSFGLASIRSCFRSEAGES